MPFPLFLHIYSEVCLKEVMNVNAIWACRCATRCVSGYDSTIKCNIYCRIWRSWTKSKKCLWFVPVCLVQQLFEEVYVRQLISMNRCQRSMCNGYGICCWHMTSAGPMTSNNCGHLQHTQIGRLRAFPKGLKQP